MPKPITLSSCRLTGFSKMDKAILQLRFAELVAARKFYCGRRSCMKVARNPASSDSAETMQTLEAYLRAAEAHRDSLCGLWDGLLNAAPSLGRQEEMRLTMVRYEIVVCELNAIQMRAFDL